MQKKRKIKVASLFAGCGGGDLGLRGGFRFLQKKYPELGYDTIWANEIEENAAETYKKNIGGHIVVGDICGIKNNKIPKHDLLIGGFPCQSFSIVGRRNGLKDPRGQLYLEMVRILKNKKPKAFIAENVKGLVSIGKGVALRRIIVDFENAGYKVTYKVLNASFYGVPQKRERVFIVGIRNDFAVNFKFPKEPNKRISLKRVVQKHSEIEKKYFFSKKAHEGLKRANKAFNKGRVQDLDNPSNTISTHLAKTSLNSTDPVLLVKKDFYRRFTPLEAARIQSFPDNFEFVKSDGKKYIQIGNAIPPVLMWHVAKALQKQLFYDRHIFKKEKK